MVVRWCVMVRWVRCGWWWVGESVPGRGGWAMCGAVMAAAGDGRVGGRVADLVAAAGGRLMRAVRWWWAGGGGGNGRMAAAGGAVRSAAGAMGEMGGWWCWWW